MAAYRRVYDSHQLQADCQEPGTGISSYTLRSVIGYGLPLLLLLERGYRRVLALETGMQRDTKRLTVYRELNNRTSAVANAARRPTSVFYQS